MTVPKLRCDRTDGHLAHAEASCEKGKCVGLSPLFCCDADLERIKETTISSTESVAGMSLGSDHWWRVWRCPSCDRHWVEGHDHHTGSGLSHDWDAQRMIEQGESYKEPNRDLLCTLFYLWPHLGGIHVRHYEVDCKREAVA